MHIDYDLWQTDDDIDIAISHDHPVETDRSTTIIKISAQGIILDFFQNGELTGTIGMTYEEWFDLSQRQVAGQEVPQ